MRISTRLIFGGLAAALLLSLAVSTAVARRIQVNEQKFYVKWTNLQFGEPTFGVEPVKCPVTLLGSFHSRTISKVLGQLIGYVNHAVVGRPEACTGGEATILSEHLPWHVRYDSFAGTLPAITRVRLQLVGTAFRIHITEINTNCLYTTTETQPAKGDATVEAGGAVTGLTALREFRIRKTEGGFLCPGEGEFHNTGSVVAGSENSTTRLVLRLVQ
jgi:hypothetical protein